jgi:hypothetical protein
VKDAASRQVVGHREDIRSGAWFAVVWNNGSPQTIDSSVSESPFSCFVDAHIDIQITNAETTGFVILDALELLPVESELGINE